MPLAILNLQAHADTFIAPAIRAVLGAGVVDVSLYVDYDSTNALPLAHLTNPSPNTFSVASGLQVSHVPYGVANISFCCSQGVLDDQLYYRTLYDATAILSMPTAFKVGGAQATGAAPPTYNTATSSPNSSNGGTNWGIEFGLSASYLGLDTGEDSWDSAAMAGFLGALRLQHPGWTWFDIKAALRQTASNWKYGYSHTAFGYGLIDWVAANAVSSPTALYLQPPGMQISVNPNGATITLYPFRQSRRAYEVVYAIAAWYVWPKSVGELPGVDVRLASGTLLYTSNGTDITPSFTINLLNCVHLIAFTTDGLDHYSRVEEFSTQTVGSSCAADGVSPSADSQ